MAGEAPLRGLTPRSPGRSEWVTRGLSGSVLAVGLLTIAGWITESKPLLQPVRGTVAMVVNAAVLFTLLGGALLVPRHSRFRYPVQVGVGLVTATLAALTFTQYVFGTQLGVDTWLMTPWMRDNHPYPGRMSPVTSLGFVLLGVSLVITNQRPGKKLAAVVACSCFLVFTMGALSVAGYVLGVDFLYGGYRYVRVAFASAGGLILGSVALWSDWKGSPRFVDQYQGSEDRRIGLTAASILAVVALTAGLAGFSSMQRATEQSLERSLQRALDYRIMHTTQELTRQSKLVESLGASAALRAALRTGDAAALRARLEAALPLGYRGLAVLDRSGRVLALAGTFSAATVELPLRLSAPASLRWENEAVLQIQWPIIEDGQHIGALRANLPLRYFTALLQDPRALGDSALLELCGLEGEYIACFPSGAESDAKKWATRVREQLVPMGYAVAGRTGTLSNAWDQRGRLVFAAHRPLPSSNLGMVLQIDAAELYGPTSSHLRTMLPLLLLLIAGSVLVLKSRVTPLVRQIVASEQRALTAIKEVMRNERQTRAVVDGVSDAIVTLDAEATIGSFNPAATRIFGFEPAEAIGQSIALLLTPEAHAEFVARFEGSADPQENAAAGGASTELQARHKDGSTLDVELTVSEIRTGDRPCFVAVLRDITERRRIERMKREFIATVSHELRTPLTSIHGSLGLITGGALGPVPNEVRKLVAIAHDNSERLVRMINELLDMEKIEAGRMQFRFEPHDIAPLVTKAIDATLGYAAQFDVTLRLETEFVSAGVMADADRVQQVLVNLLSNAVKYSPRGGTVRVLLRDQGEMARIIVQDDGPGIPEAFHQRIFSKFSQADASDARAKGGTGLGLSIAKAIVDRHGGTIGFETEAGRGTSFYVDFPLCVWSRTRLGTPGSGSRHRVLFSAPSILHVDDDAESRAVVAALLDPIARVVGAASLAEARARLAESKFELVLLDLGLPDGWGAQLLDDLENRASGRIPVIVFTAYGDKLESALRDRVDGVLIKAHVSVEHFQMKVRDLLQSQAGSTQAVS
jgi:PAS domain S-box-containing protein